MISKQRIKKLAKISADNDSIPPDISEYVLSYLGKKDLKDFLRYYKAALDKKRIYVTSSDVLSKENTSMLKNLYKDRDIIVTIEKELGAGLKLRDCDMIMDFTFKKYITDTIEKLKN